MCHGRKRDKADNFARHPEFQRTVSGNDSHSQAFDFRYIHDYILNDSRRLASVLH